MWSSPLPVSILHSPNHIEGGISPSFKKNSKKKGKIGDKILQKCSFMGITPHPLTTLKIQIIGSLSLFWNRKRSVSYIIYANVKNNEMMLILIRKTKLILAAHNTKKMYYSKNSK